MNRLSVTSVQHKSDKQQLTVSYLDSNIAQCIQSQLPNASVCAVNAQNKKPASTAHNNSRHSPLFQCQTDNQEHPFTSF